MRQLSTGQFNKNNKIYKAVSSPQSDASLTQITDIAMGGGNLKISSDNGVTFNDVGTKYYNHNIRVQYSGLYLSFNIISTKSTPFTITQLCQTYDNREVSALGFCKPLTTNNAIIISVWIKNEEYNQFRCNTVVYSKDASFTYGPLNYVAGVANSGENFTDYVTALI